MTKNGADKSLILKAIDMKRHITKVKEKVGKVKIVKSVNQTLGKASVSIESKGNLFSFCGLISYEEKLLWSYNSMITLEMLKAEKLIENNFTQGILIYSHILLQITH